MLENNLPQKNEVIPEWFAGEIEDCLILCEALLRNRKKYKKLQIPGSQIPNYKNLLKLPQRLQTHGHISADQRNFMTRIFSKAYRQDNLGYFPFCIISYFHRYNYLNLDSDLYYRAQDCLTEYFYGYSAEQVNRILEHEKEVYGSHKTSSKNVAQHIFNDNLHRYLRNLLSVIKNGDLEEMKEFLEILVTFLEEESIFLDIEPEGHYDIDSDMYSVFSFLLIGNYIKDADIKAKIADITLNYYNFHDMEHEREILQFMKADNG